MRRHPVTPKHALAELQHRRISNLELDATVAMIKRQAGTTDLREVARAMDIRIFELTWKASNLHGIAIPQGIVVCAYDTEDDKLQTIAHELMHIVLITTDHSHGDVYYGGGALLRDSALFYRCVNDMPSWAQLLNVVQRDDV